MEKRKYSQDEEANAVASNDLGSSNPISKQRHQPPEASPLRIISLPSAQEELPPPGSLSSSDCSGPSLQSAQDGTCHKRRKSRWAKAKNTLPQSVLVNNAEHILASSLPQFEYPESEIQILGLISHGEYAVVFRISAGGRTFVLKVHKYEPCEIASSSFPKRNQYYESESAAYAKMAYLQHSSQPPIPKCFGYVDLTGPRQAISAERKPRHLFRSSRYRQAVYLDFLRVPDSEDECTTPEDLDQDLEWRDYFKNESSKCVLRGLVLEEVNFRVVSDNDLIKGKNNSLATSGSKSLALIHKSGILHGDVKNIDNALVAIPHERIVWINFSLARNCSRMDKRTFKKHSAQEISRWNSFLFSPR